MYVNCQKKESYSRELWILIGYVPPLSRFPFKRVVFYTSSHEYSNQFKRNETASKTTLEHVLGGCIYAPTYTIE